MCVDGALSVTICNSSYGAGVSEGLRSGAPQRPFTSQPGEPSERHTYDESSTPSPTSSSSTTPIEEADEDEEEEEEEEVGVEFITTFVMLTPAQSDQDQVLNIVSF